MKDGKELKRERFIRIVERRVDKTLEDIESLGKCANKRNYEYSEGDIRKIFGALEKKLKEIKLLFQSSDQKKKRFKLQSG
jgi:hypothetical protein